MREIYATPSGRVSGVSAMCLCLNQGTPQAQHNAAAAIRTALLDDHNDSHVSQVPSPASPLQAPARALG